MSTLPLQDRLRLGWELTWPLAVIDLAVVFVIHGLMNVDGDSLDSIWALAVFLVVSPYVVRRAFRMRRISVARSGGATGELRYGESLKVMWLLAWRSLVIVLLAIFLFSAALRALGLPRLALHGLSPLANALGLSLVDSVISLGTAPFLISGMLRKKYRGFRLVTQ